MYYDKNGKQVYIDYEKKNGIKISEEFFALQKEKGLPFFFNSIHFIQKLYHSFNDDETINILINKVYDMANNQNKYYHQKTIKKRNGKDRILNIPSDELKMIQSYIAKRVLVWFKAPLCAMAYTKTGGIKKNALSHSNSNYYLKLDIHDFFGSIHFGKIVNNIVPKDCYDESFRILITNLCMKNGALTQGAPSSPAISNIVMYKFDKIMMEYAKENNLKYTRYADDMIFSSKDKFNPNMVINKVSYLLKKYYDMELNNEKTVFLHDGLKIDLCGVIVNDHPQVSKEYRDKIRQEIYYINKYGIEKHIYAMYYDHKINEVLKPLEYYKILIGKINYVLSINRDDKIFIKYKELIDSYIDELKPKKPEGRKAYPDIFEKYLTSNLRFNLNDLSDELFLINCFINDYKKTEEIMKRVCKIIPGGNSPLWYLRRNYTRGNFNLLLDDIEYNLDYFSEMAYKNDLVATYFLMIYYANLPDDRFDYMLFKYWSDRLSTMGVGRGLLIDALNFNHSEDEKLNLIKKAANLLDPKAQYNYAKIVENTNESEYIEYMVSAADNGNKDASYYAGLIFEKYKFYEEAYVYFLKNLEEKNLFKISEYSKKYNYYVSDNVKNLIEELTLYGEVFDYDDEEYFDDYDEDDDFDDEIDDTEE